MREILFRGKHKESGTWVLGWYCGQVNEFMFSDAKESTQIIEKDTLLWAEVDPSTVGQYTGLCDKNGRKIFEGDIVKFPAVSIMGETLPESYAKVKYSASDGGWMLEYGGRTGDDCLDSDSALNCCVVGNIHDNPELMEGKV